MGCDFQLTGNQPNKQLQDQCLEYLRAYSKLVKPDYRLDILDVDTRVLSGVHVERRTSLVFRPGPEIQLLGQKYQSSNVSGHSRFKGIAVPEYRESRPGAFMITFDQDFDGTLCSIQVPEGQPVPARYGQMAYVSNAPEAPENTIISWFGCATRFFTGQADFYVVSFVMKHHFIPNLDIQEDYDLEIYDRIMERSTVARELREASLNQLPALTLEIVKYVQKIYNAACGRNED